MNAVTETDGYDLQAVLREYVWSLIPDGNVKGFARRVDIAQQNLNQMVKGERFINANHLVKICAAEKIALSDLLLELVRIAKDIEAGKIHVGDARRASESGAVAIRTPRGRRLVTRPELAMAAANAVGGSSEPTRTRRGRKGAPSRQPDESAPPPPHRRPSQEG